MNWLSVPLKQDKALGHLMAAVDRAQGSKIGLVEGTLTFPKLEVARDRSTKASWREGSGRRSLAFPREAWSMLRAQIDMEQREEPCLFLCFSLRPLLALGVASGTVLLNEWDIY